MNSTKEEFLWSRTACRLVVNAVSHPIEYAKVLIQVIFNFTINNCEVMFQFSLFCILII